jgi:hypothetical protein
MPRPESSIWGNILTCIEVGLHIYAIHAERNSGLVLDADYAQDVLSEDALKLGERQGDHIYFDDVKGVVPAYELAKQGAITHPEWSEVAENPERIAENGKYFAPEYFGAFNPPHHSSDTISPHHQQLDNGIYFVERDGSPALAVHQVIGEQVLSDMALHQAGGHGEYLLYPLKDCAIPIYELSASHPTVAQHIVSDESLAHTLYEDFPNYVAMHNLHTEEWGHIHNCAAPKSLFLQIQLDQAAATLEPELVQQHMAAAYETTSSAELLQVREPDDFFEPSGELEL